MSDAQRPQQPVSSDPLPLTQQEAATVLRLGRTPVYALTKADDRHSVHIGRSCHLEDYWRSTEGRPRVGGALAPSGATSSSNPAVRQPGPADGTGSRPAALPKTARWSPRYWRRTEGPSPTLNGQVAASCRPHGPIAGCRRAGPNTGEDTT